MPPFRALSAVWGAGRSSSASAAESASGGDADVWRSSRHGAPSEMTSAVSGTPSRRSSGSGSALMVTMSRPPRPTAAASAGGGRDGKSKSDTSQKKKKKERITRTTKPGSSTQSKTTNKSSSHSKSKASSSSANATATDRGRSRTKRDRNEQVNQSQARPTTSRSSTPVARNANDGDDAQNVEQEVYFVEYNVSPSPPSSSANTSNLSSSPESSASIADCSEGSLGNTTVSTITQTMALDPARMAQDYPELAASLKHHPMMVERTLRCPSGALGCQIDDSSTGPIIDDVLASSSMGGLLFPGDRILSVDGLDVRGIKCSRVKAIMAERRDHEREIKVLSIINLAENGCKGDREPREGEARNRNKSSTKQRKKRASAVSSVPTNTDSTPKSALLHRRSVVAPSGKLGLVLRNTKDGPAVHTVKPTSPLQGQVFVGDRIVRVGITDTTTMRAKELTKLIAGDSTKTRAILVLSAVDATIKRGKAEEVMPASAPSPASNPTPASFGGGAKKPSLAMESITSATASLSTRSDTKNSDTASRSDTKNSDTAGPEEVEKPSTPIDHGLPPFRSTPTPSRRKEGESLPQYLARKRENLSKSQAEKEKECDDEPSCTDTKSSRSSDESRSTVVIARCNTKLTTHDDEDAAIQQYERLIGCLEMGFDVGQAEVSEKIKMQQAAAQEEVIALCDVLRDLYKAKGEKAKSVKCLRKKVETQRSLLKLKMEMM